MQRVCCKGMASSHHQHDFSVFHRFPHWINDMVIFIQYDFGIFGCLAIVLLNFYLRGSPSVILFLPNICVMSGTFENDFILNERGLLSSDN